MLLPILLINSVLAGSSGLASPMFSASGITGQSSTVLTGDLDGDGLKDLVLLDDTNLSIFYQDPRGSFTREAQSVYHLEPRPCVVWTAKLGGPAASLLVMTCNEVTELRFTNRTATPAIRQIIRQSTIVPNDAERTNALCLPLTVGTGGDWPLLLAPAEDGLHVWQHRDEWGQAQIIPHAIEASLRPTAAQPGYITSLGLDLSVGDINGDGRDDLIVRRSEVGWTNTYRIYLQQTNGLFAGEPSLTYADEMQWDSWLCWADLNRDGKVDLIKSVWLHEPSFAPGMPSGKVLVGVHLADDHGRIPTEPQAVFRKNDWTPALPVVDVDGDGFPDLVLGYSTLDSRDGLRKEVTAKQLDYRLRLFFYRPGVGFPKEADCQRDVIIHMDKIAVLLGSSPHRYFEHSVQFGGDFNGDGKRDLLLRDRGDAISVYFFVSRQVGFSPEPDRRFSCPERVEEWQVEDLNNDGVSDLIVKLAEGNGLRVFISRK